MAIKNLIARGIGFSPGSVKFMPTLGFSVGADEPAGNICLSATDMRDISQNASFNNNISLGASEDINDDINGDWSTC